MTMESSHHKCAMTNEGCLEKGGNQGGEAAGQMTSLHLGTRQTPRKGTSELRAEREADITTKWVVGEPEMQREPHGSPTAGGGRCWRDRERCACGPGAQQVPGYTGGMKGGRRQEDQAGLCRLCRGLGFIPRAVESLKCSCMGWHDEK